jgi:hypothetical protein
MRFSNRLFLGGELGRFDEFAGCSGAVSVSSVGWCECLLARLFSPHHTKAMGVRKAKSTCAPGDQSVKTVTTATMQRTKYRARKKNTRRSLIIVDMEKAFFLTLNRVTWFAIAIA